MGAAALGVGTGAAYQAEALERDLGFPCLVDPSKNVYRSLGIRRIGVGWLDVRAVWRYVRGIARGARQGSLTGDILQAPGVAVLDEEAGVRYAHRGRALGDYPPLGDVLERLRDVAGA